MRFFFSEKKIKKRNKQKKVIKKYQKATSEGEKKLIHTQIFNYEEGMCERERNEKIDYF